MQTVWVAYSLCPRDSVVQVYSPTEFHNGVTEGTEEEKDLFIGLILTSPASTANDTPEPSRASPN